MVARAPRADAADAKAPKRGTLSDQEHAVMCWLRMPENLAVAKSYGLEKIGLRTTVGEMLMMLLAYMGMVVKWASTPPPPTADGAPAPLRASAAHAVYIESVTRRSGPRLKPNQQPLPRAPQEAAINGGGGKKKRGRPKKAVYPLIGIGRII